MTRSADAGTPGPLARRDAGATVRAPMSASIDTAARKRTRRAVLALSAVTLIWGATFVWMKSTMSVAREHLGDRAPTSGLALFLALRFGLAAIFIALFVRSSRRGLGRETWTAGLVLALPLSAGFTLQMVGLDQLSPAVSAFLTSLYVLFTAAILALAAKKRAQPRIRLPLVFGAVLATVGAGLVRGRPELGFTLDELVTVCGAFAFAVHLLLTHVYTQRLPPMSLTLTSFAWVALFSSIGFVIAASSRDAPSTSAIGALLADPEFQLNLMFMSLLGTVLALSLMNYFQRDLDPVRASILYALEPIWAALFGVACGLDRFTGWLVVGGAILLCGNLVAERGGNSS